MEVNLRLKNINKQYDSLEIFRNFSIAFVPHKINCILGPSGCGKTSLLNIINGSEPISSGNRDDFMKRSMSYVFQEPRLLPWKTVEQNIEFVLKDQLGKAERKKRVQEHLRYIEMEEFRNYYPGKLSGGMKQRVSLARAFSYESDIILMDEPFKALDRKLKGRLMEQFIRMWKKEERTVIYVTHEVDEAVKIGHKIFLFSSSPVKILKEYTHSGGSKNKEITREIISVMESDHF